MLDDLPRLREALGTSVVEEGELLLIGRRELRSNNSWMHNVPRLVSGQPRCVLRMHPDDARARQLDDEIQVRVQSRVGEVEVTLRVDDDIMPGVVSLPHGYGHAGREGTRLSVASSLPGASANDLTDDAAVDEASGNAVLNGVPVRVSRVAAG